ncbi:hypothetical protein FACS1894199_14150 [Bacteroidia bacterium]|nr:hypothetical protein FACS1894199_14150 [Bacteroidia bacterium]
MNGRLKGVKRVSIAIIVPLLVCCCGTSPKSPSQAASSAVNASETGTTGAETGGTAVATVAGSSSSVTYDRHITFLYPEKGTVFSYNSELSITLQNTKGFPLDSVHFFIDNRRVSPTVSLNVPPTASPPTVSHYTLKAPSHKVGNVTLKVVAFHGNDSTPANSPANSPAPIQASIDTRTITVKPDTPPVRHSYEVVNKFPHDRKAFTQGLVCHQGYLYESTGEYGRSGIRKIDRSDWKVVSMLSIDNHLFGEGITIYKDKIVQLTWTSRKGFVYDLGTFSLESTFTYNTQGWGITTIGDELIMSDGTNKLYRLDPRSFSVTSQIEVWDDRGAVDQLNELELIDGLVWANVWQTDRIVMIDPVSGAIKGDLDMSGLLSVSERSHINEREDVLNGIAVNVTSGTVYVTGKNWPSLFEINVGM